jgi:16S rRNA processing protein RimM
MVHGPDDTPAWPDDAIEVGCIVDAWGVGGAFKVQPFSDDPQALYSSRRWFLKPPAGASVSRRAAVPSLLRITSARPHGDLIVAHARDIGDRTAAEALRGARVFVSRASFPTAADDEFYWIDLIGMTVLNRQGETLGEVIGLVETGPHSVLRVRPAEQDADRGADILIPFVAAYIDAVSLAERRITVDWHRDY